MSIAKDQFKKQGGFKLIKNYIKNRVFITALNQYAILGKTKTSLEILRLSIQFKVKKRLEKSFTKYLKEFDENYKSNKYIQKSSDYVWICWLQGIENAPFVVQKCYESVKKNLKNKKVILITEENYNDYIQFPKFIEEKYKKGIITKTHLTDLLRLELLIKYGGMWLDATVLCTMSENRIPDYYFNSDLFLYQNLKPGKDGHSIFVSSWLISAKTNNKILMASRFLCYKYWKKYNYMRDYFLLHIFLCMSLEYYEDEWKKIIPSSNSEPHILLLRLFEDCNEKIVNYLNEKVPFHKLTYKFDDNNIDKEGTYYKYFIN